MRKFFFILAACMAAAAVWALDPVDHVVGGTVYLTNISCNGASLSFNDTFHPEMTVDRMYRVSAFAKTPQTAIYPKIGTTGYEYGYVVPNELTPYCHSTWFATAQDRFYYNSAGGTVIVDINSVLDAARDNEVETIHFVISGRYKDLLGEWHTYEALHVDGESFNTYFDYPMSVITCYIPNNSYAIEDTDTQLNVKIRVKAYGSANYSLQRNSEQGGNDWFTLATGNISTVDAKAGADQNVLITLNESKSKNFDLRLIAKTVKTGAADTAYSEVACAYKYTRPNGLIEYLYPGTKRFINIPPDCHIYNYICSKPVEVTTHPQGQTYIITMPAADLTIEEVVPTYTVKFFNQNYTLLKAEEVACGDDATAPADPTMPNLYFDHWSRDFTNVHSNLTVWAQYTMAGNYYFETGMTEHLNELHPMEGFAGSPDRAMVGDAVTFQATLLTPQDAKLYYETCFRNEDGTWTLWTAPTNNIVGSVTAEDIAAGQAKVFTKQVEVALQSNQERERTHGFAFRFYVICGGERINSEPYEFGVYYPVTVKSQIDFSGAYEGLFAENSDGLFNIGENLVIPTRYDDTIRIYRLEGGAGACINYTYVEHPSWGVQSGLDEEGNSYFLCPGATSTVNVDVAKTLVVFDGVYGNGYPKQLDFSAQGFGKLNGYYGEVVPCGGSVTMPEDPTMDNAVFIGWQAWNTDYADDAYLNVPVGESMIGFSALFDYLPDVPTYTVIFFDKEGNILSTQDIKEGENAVPPAAPEVDGFHFVGWDNTYTTITNDKDIYAVYGENDKTWTVTYWNCADFWPTSYTTIGTEQVNDGEAAPQQIIPVAGEEGYTFAFWATTVTNNGTTIRDTDVEADLSHVTGDIDVYARWKKSEYTITYTLDGVEIMSEQVTHGGMPAAYQTIEDQGKPATEQYVYTFDHWNPAIAPATADATYEAVFTQSLRKYLVRFQNWDHTLLSEQQVEYGKAAQAPADPTREGYTFTGWDREFNSIIADVTVTALFEKAKEQGIENTPSPLWGESERGYKFLRDGVLYIVRPDGKTFNAQGTRVR